MNFLKSKIAITIYIVIRDLLLWTLFFLVFYGTIFSGMGELYQRIIASLVISGMLTVILLGFFFNDKE